MKVVQINSTCSVGSTGRIAHQISLLCNKEDIENYVLYSMYTSDYEKSFNFCSRALRKRNALKSRILGNLGFENKKATRTLIKKLKEIDPDIVHLHNIHSHDVNVTMLFNYLNNEHKKVIWTFHDCWAFTGGCMHFDYIGCEKWKKECDKCPLYKEHSWFFDRSKTLFNRKKEAYQNLDMTITTPSHWLAGLVKESFLKEKEVKVINNGIDLNMFYPRESDFREKYHLQDKKIILFCSFRFDDRKGIKDILKISEEINGDKYAIVIVGHIDNKEYAAKLDKKVIHIEQTNSQEELAKIYSASDVLVNVTYEDTYPTTNMESLACSTPVICYQTGGAIEMLDEKTGIAVKKGDVSRVIELINNEEFTKLNREDCLKKAKGFDKDIKFEEYVKLYKSVGQK